MSNWIRGWTRTHLVVGVTIALMVIISGCCFLGAFGGLSGLRFPAMGGWGAPQAPGTGTFGWLIAVIGWGFFIVFLVAGGFWVLGKLGFLRRRRGGRR
jgi:hypothetical protein